MSELTSAIVNAANQYGIDPNILLAVAARESGGDDINAIHMVSNDIGAQGMMQIMPETASNYGVDNLYPNWNTDPTQNALAGAYILKKKIEEQGGDVWQGVRAYNGAGPAAEEYMTQVQADYNKLGGEKGSSPFTYQARTSDGVPFLNLAAYLRTNNPDEKLDAHGLMEMMALSDATGQKKVASDMRLLPDYDLAMSGYSDNQKSLLSPVVKKLQDYRAGYDNANAEQNGFLGKLGTGVQAVNLINHSNNTANRAMYASLAKQLGVNVNPGTDQFVGGNQLLGFREQQEAQDSEYNESIRQMKQAQDDYEQTMAFKKKNLNDLYNLQLSGILGGADG